MGKFVRIQSEKNIEVTEGLNSIDMTNRDAHVADRLKVATAWVQTRVMIKRGSELYPACLVEWESVKSLAKLGLLTIGETLDAGNEFAEKLAEKIERAHASYKARSDAAKTDSIVGAKTRGRKKAESEETTDVGDVIEQ